MSVLLEKSKQSLKVAKLSFDNNYYPSTVNRSYYACLQLMLHILFNKLNKDREEFYNEVRHNPNGGTHIWASKLIGIELIKKDKDDYKWFQKNIPEFREKRVLADYYEDTISYDDGDFSIKRAESVINLLNKNFN